MSKIDRIRRKLEENKRKSIFHDVTVNPHLSHPSFANTHQLLPNQPFPTTFSLFPLIAKQPSRNASTNHSERSLTADAFQPDPLITGRKTLGHIFMERSRLRSHRQRQGHNVDELAAKTLNPSNRINWACQKESMATPMKNAGSCVINAQTPSAVIILTEPLTPSGSLGRTLFRRTAPKRPSIMIRQPSTPPQKTDSPTRKFSISAWDTYDQE